MKRKTFSFVWQSTSKRKEKEEKQISTCRTLGIHMMLQNRSLQVLKQKFLSSDHLFFKYKQHQNKNKRLSISDREEKDHRTNQMSMIKIT